MGLFGDPNKKVKRIISELEKSGANPEAFKERKSCYNCAYFVSSLGHCNFHNKRTRQSELCSNFWAR